MQRSNKKVLLNGFLQLPLSKEKIEKMPKIMCAIKVTFVNSIFHLNDNLCCFFGLAYSLTVTAWGNVQMCNDTK